MDADCVHCFSAHNQFMQNYVSYREPIEIVGKL